jgi:response regulator RpfG family c-di-GMP phosphodiesterase
MSNGEGYLRFVVSLAILIFGVSINSYLFMILGIMIASTAIFRHCFIYDIFNLNKKITLEALYLRNLPKYNPEPIFILDHEGVATFKNTPAKKYITVENFKNFLAEENLSEIIEKEKIVSKQYKCEKGKTYLINFRGIKTLNYIFAYTTEITSVLEAEEEIINTQKDVVYTMGAIGETRSKETGNHVKRVALYSELLALKCGLPKKEAELLKLASPMHDIGKVGIKDEILNKPGKLTPDEFEIMKTHAELGYDMLKNSEKEILRAAATVAYEHHEKWDGSGYPRGLSGEDIHIYGRITAIADVFDALGSDRVYKKAWSLDKIFDLLKNQDGKHFDPKLVKIFFDNFDEFDKIRKAYVDK